MNIIGVIIFLLVVVSLRNIKKQDGEINTTTDKAYRNKGDSIGTLLDRIEWAVYRPGKIAIISRCIFLAFILTFVTSIGLTGSFPVARHYLLTMIVIFSFLIAFNFYFNWHSDKFTSYATISNVNKLRHKLRVKKGDLSKKSIRSKSFKGWQKPWIFIY